MPSLQAGASGRETKHNSLKYTHTHTVHRVHVHRDLFKVIILWILLFLLFWQDSGAQQVFGSSQRQYFSLQRSARWNSPLDRVCAQTSSIFLQFIYHYYIRLDIMTSSPGPWGCAVVSGTKTLAADPLGLWWDISGGGGRRAKMVSQMRCAVWASFSDLLSNWQIYLWQLLFCLTSAEWIFFIRLALYQIIVRFDRKQKKERKKKSKIRQCHANMESNGATEKTKHQESYIVHLTNGFTILLSILLFCIPKSLHMWLCHVCFV